MFDWLKLLEEQRKEIINATSAAKGYPAFVIEKDWWVTLALRAVFSTRWAEHIVFKGGTSLSKAWKLIERFSEDIDLAIDKAALGFSEELNKGQVKKLRQKSAAFMEHEFMPELERILLKMGIDSTSFTLSIKPVESNDVDPRIIILEYKSIVEENPYVQSRVLIEITARSLREPFEMRPITSFISENYQDLPFADPSFEAPTVRPERTFLEKACLLHEEFIKEPEKRKHERLSRHLLDLHQVRITEYGIAAIDDKELFNTIVAHRQRYNPVRGITYTNHTYAAINFIPPEEVRIQWEEDYRRMVETMIYNDDAPNYDKLIISLQELIALFRSKA